jgi:O-antigen ligase
MERSGRFAAGVLPARSGPLVFAIGAILFLTLLGPLMTISGLSMTGEGSPLRQQGYLLILLLTIVAMRPLSAPRRLLAVPVALLVALGWCWLSLVWAIEPSIAARRLVLTTVVIWTIFMATEQLGYERTLALLRVAVVLALIGNFIAVVGFPETGIHHADEVYEKALVGNWRGIMAHKNFAGAACALTILLFTFDADRINKFVRGGVILAAIFFLVKSSSKTSMGVCAAAIAVGFLFQFYRARYRGAVVVAAFLAGAVGAAVYNVHQGTVTNALNDRTAFTGRTQIWWTLSNYIGDHPLLGAGYGSFWNIGGSSPVYQYATNWVRDIASGHNGFLDLTTQIGYPGIVLVVVGVLVWPLVRLFGSPAAQGPRGALIIGLLLFCIGHNMTESSLMDRDAIVEVFLMFAIALLWTILSERGAPYAASSAAPRAFPTMTPRKAVRS